MRASLLQALDKLTDSQLDFAPHEGLWSLGQTVSHIAGAEDGWFRYLVTRELRGWDAADFKAADYSTIIAARFT